MKYKLNKVVLILILVVSVLLSAATCSTRVDEDRNTVKPDIKTALDNYDALVTKKSEFNGKVTMKLFGQLNTRTGEVPLYTVGQEAKLDRILNDGTTYMEGRLGSCNVSDNVTSLIGGLKGVAKAALGLSDKDLEGINSTVAYLNGYTYYTMNMGHKGGNYNIKTTFHDGQASPEPYWAATNDDSINAFISNQNINYEIKVSEYLMFSTFMDLSKASKWIVTDNASKFLSTDSHSFFYNIEANNEKIYDMVFDTIAKYVGMLSVNDYVEFLELYTKVLPYLKKWITIGKANVDASVNIDALPTQMTTKTTVYLDMDLKDIFEVVDILIEKKEDNDRMKAVLNLGNVWLRGRDGLTGKLSMDFDIVLEEKFSYDDASCSLDKADPDMFLEVTAENSSREVYIVAKESAVPNSEELEGNNDIKVSEGNDEGNTQPGDDGDTQNHQDDDGTD